MRVAIPATKTEITLVSVELRAMGAIFDRLAKIWRIDQHLIYDALALIAKGPNAALRATLAAERGDVAQNRELSSADISRYCAENGVIKGCTLRSWQVTQALSIQHSI